MRVDKSRENLAFIFWALIPLKGLLTAVLFKNLPSLGTAFGITTSLLILLLTLIISSIQGSAIYKFLVEKALAVLLYIAWSGLSIVWSYAESRPVAFFYWVSQVVDVFTVFFLATRVDQVRFLERSLQGFIFGTAVLMLGFFLISDVGNDGRLTEDILHVNSVAYYLSLAALFCIYFILNSKARRENKVLWKGMFVIFCAAIMFSLSKTSIVSFGFAVLSLIVFGKGARTSALALVCVLIAISLIMWPFLDAYLSAYLLAQGEGSSTAETLSGRTILWAGVYEMIVQHPWFGYGFMSFRDVGPDVFSIRVPHAHNEILQQLFSLGVVGTIFFIKMYYDVVKSCLKNILTLDGGAPLARVSLVGVALCVMVVARGLTEASVLGSILPLPLLVLILSSTHQRA